MSQCLTPNSKTLLNKSISDREESKNPKKIKNAHKKFNKIIINQDLERKNKTIKIENFLTNFEKEVNNTEFEILIKNFKEEINTIHENLLEEKKNLEVIGDKYSNEINNYLNYLNNKFEEEKAKRLDESNRIIKLTEDKSFSLNTNINKSIIDLENKADNKLNEIEDKLEEIKDKIENETSEREEGILLINEQIEEETKKFQSRLTIENNQREETMNKLNSMIDEFNQDFNNKIKKEKVVRQENNENLLKLIDETCDKLDKKLGSYTYI